MLAFPTLPPSAPGKRLLKCNNATRRMAIGFSCNSKCNIQTQQSATCNISAVPLIDTNFTNGHESLAASSFIPKLVRKTSGVLAVARSRVGGRNGGELAPCLAAEDWQARFLSF